MTLYRHRSTNRFVSLVHWVLNISWIPVHWVFEFNWIVQMIFCTIKLKWYQKHTQTYLALLNLNVLFRKWKRTYDGENISGLSLKQEVPVMVKPCLLELLYVRISGLSLSPWTRGGDHASIKVKRRHLGPRGWPLFVLSFRWIRARNLQLGRTFQNTVCTKFVPRKDWESADHRKILNHFVIPWIFYICRYSLCLQNDVWYLGDLTTINYSK